MALDTNKPAAAPAKKKKAKKQLSTAEYKNKRLALTENGYMLFCYTALTDNAFQNKLESLAKRGYKIICHFPATKQLLLLEEKKKGTK